MSKEVIEELELLRSDFAKGLYNRSSALLFVGFDDNGVHISVAGDSESVKKTCTEMVTSPEFTDAVKNNLVKVRIS